MPQVFGVEALSLIREASLWVEAGASESDVEKATHPMVAAEARARGLVPLRMGTDPIWLHPETSKTYSLAAGHAGDVGRRIDNDIANIRRNHPTPEEAAKASRTPEQIEADSAAAAKATRDKKQQGVDAAKRRREQEEAILFRKQHSPFRNMGEVERAFNKQQSGPKPRPGDTTEQFAERLRGAAPDVRQQIHRMVFPERYTKAPG